MEHMIDGVDMQKAFEDAKSKGDWSLVEPFEIADTKGKDDKQDKQPQ